MQKHGLRSRVPCLSYHAHGTVMLIAYSNRRDFSVSDTEYCFYDAGAVLLKVTANPASIQSLYRAIMS